MPSLLSDPHRPTTKSESQARLQTRRALAVSDWGKRKSVILQRSGSQRSALRSRLRGRSQRAVLRSRMAKPPKLIWQREAMPKPAVRHLLNWPRTRFWPTSWRRRPLQRRRVRFLRRKCARLNPSFQRIVSKRKRKARLWRTSPWRKSPSCRHKSRRSKRLLLSRKSRPLPRESRRPSLRSLPR